LIHFLGQGQPKTTREKIIQEKTALKTKKIDPKIINLSSQDLDNDEINLLKRGLKFTPIPNKNLQELHNDTQEFCRKLRLREFFSDKDVLEDESLVRNNSYFNPPRVRDSDLDTYIKAISKFPSNQGNKAVQSNILRGKKNAIDRLRSDDFIIIKTADKGGAVVIMDMEYYREKMEEQILDSHFYTEIADNADRKTMCAIRKLLSKYPNCLTAKECDFLVNFEVKCSNIYGLPKIYKSKHIQEATELQNAEYVKIYRPNDLKLRPIVAGPACPTHRLSELLDILLKPLLKYIPSYIRDDMDFIQHLPREVDPDSILVSFDVTSLYTNIPHNLGIEDINFWLEKHSEEIHRRFSIKCILDALNIILTCNTFYFDGKFFLQKIGTAMGTKVMPTYTNLVMGCLEEIQ